MRKAWAIFALVLLIGLQVTALSLFHTVNASGPAFGNTDVCIAKWSYVQATVHVEISSNPFGPVNVTLPDGAKVVVGAASSYDFTLDLPRSGDFTGSPGVYIGTQASLTQSSPIIASVDSNVSSIPFSHVCSQLEGEQNVDVTTITIAGDATVALSGYGVAL